MGFDNRKSAASDAIKDAVDYTMAIEIAGRVATDGAYRLLEACAGAIAERLLEEFPIRSVSVRARKRVPSSPAAAVGVVVHRESSDG